MKTFKIVLGVLMVLPIGLLVYHLFFAPISYDPNSLSEMAFLVFGIPILMLNFWAWTSSEIIEFYFFGKKHK